MHDDSSEDPEPRPPSTSPGAAPKPAAGDGSESEERPLVARLAWATASALREGDLQAAQRHCDTALSVARAEGNDAGVASVQTILGRVLHARGDLDALGVLEAALAVQRRGGNGRAIATTLLELGRVHITLGDLDRAHADYLEALAHFARLRSSAPEAQAQLGVASVLHAIGQLPAARRHTEVALSVAREADDATLEAECHEALGALDQESDRRHPARRAYVRASQAWHRLGDRPGEARCRLALSRLDFDAGDPVEASLDQLEQDPAVQRQPWLMGRVACLRGASLGHGGDRLAYTVLAHAASLLDHHPAWRHLPAIEQGHLDLARGDEGAAYGRLGAVPAEALRSVPVRLALASLRRRLGHALRASS